MLRFRNCLLALLLILAAPAFAAGDAGWFYRGSDITPDPAWVFGTLPNGLRYAVRQNALPAGQVSVRLRIDAGSLNETDAERGYAHFIEHMTFRGTRDYGGDDARHIWQQLGASFGSDTNAFTLPTQTVYQLDLPKNDRASLDKALDVLAEMADSARFDPAAVDGERKVVMAEKARRSELANRMIEASYPIFYAGLKMADRDAIGTDASLAAATPQGLRAFYERWYRPERAVVIMVGDADPKLMEALIAQHFGGWKGEGATPPDPDYGHVAQPPEATTEIAYAGAPYSASIEWLRPYVYEPDTVALERRDLATQLAARILNRRLEAKARGDSAFLTSVVGQDRSVHIADITQLSITARDGQWQGALGDSFAIIADALRAPPSQAEIDREISNLRTAFEAAVQADPTIQSQQRAQQILNAIDDREVITSAQAGLALINALAPQMTPAAVEQAMKALFTGSGPRMVQLAPQPIDPAAVKAALASSQTIAPATRLADRVVSLDRLPKLGKEGREISRQAIPDLGVTIVRFANGATLTFKHTDFEKGQVAVETRFGRGKLGMDPSRRTPGWLASIIGPSGLADLDLDSLERLMTGRRLGLSFGVDENAFVLSGRTDDKELGDELRLVATKLAFPRWDSQLFTRYKAGALAAYDLSWGSATSRAGREFGGFVHGNDARWAPTERDEVTGATIDTAERFFDPLLSQGPLEVIVVGDVDLETAVTAVRRSIAALPARPAPPPTAAELAVRPPAPNPQPKIFTHRGDPNQAFAVIGWTTLGGTDRLPDRRALAVAANLFQVRLFDQLREQEGASYAPNAVSISSDDFRDWGVFYAAAEIKPQDAATFFRIARSIAADLAAHPAAADEFARAQNPIVSGIERRVKTNDYWLQAMEDWVTRPEKIAATRSYIGDYSRMTAEDVRRAVATWVADAGDWSMLIVAGKADGGGH